MALCLRKIANKSTNPGMKFLPLIQVPQLQRFYEVFAQSARTALARLEHVACEACCCRCLELAYRARAAGWRKSLLGPIGIGASASKSQAIARLPPKHPLQSNPLYHAMLTSFRLEPPPSEKGCFVVSLWRPRASHRYRQHPWMQTPAHTFGVAC